MRQPALVRRVVLAGVSFVVLTLTASWIFDVAPPPVPRALSGWPLYDRYCLPCHGEAGDGKGPAAPFTSGRPRDFTRGDFAWRTTPLGSPPTDDDLRLAIASGAPGTSMHAFPLARPQLDELVEVVKAFAPQAFAKPAAPIALAPPPPVDAARGAQLWLAKGCASCHGPTGSGDTPVARTVTNPPYDLTREPLHRPRADGDLRRAAALAIATGRTPMPGYAGSISDADIWALADHVVAIGPARRAQRSDMASADPASPTRAQKSSAEPSAGDRTSPTSSQKSSAKPSAGDRTSRARDLPAGGTPPAALDVANASVVARDDAQVAPPGMHDHARRRIDARTIDLDRKDRIVAGTWPAQGEDAVVFGRLLAPQGPPPVALAPAQASLSAQQCARCHAKQYREWETSLHRAATSPGFTAQVQGLEPAEAASCLRCHAPLDEQRRDDGLRAQGLSCAGCHVRTWTRHGPPRVAPSLLALPSYPLEPLAVYERADLCLPCHQLPPRTAVEGRPLLDTYREWLEGPYMPRGIQCQHCHMPNREHAFLGIHDAHTFRQGIALTARAHVTAGAVTVVAELANIGAGHDLPTTATPAAWIVIELVDARGARIEGATASVRIGRDVYYEDGVWHERADTRIPPGDTVVVSRAWSGGRTLAATAARVSVVVSPDDYYEHLYERRLAGPLAGGRRALYEQALARAKADHYTATQRDLPLAPPTR